MKSADLPENEKERLKNLVGLEILDTPSEEIFDDFTRLASYICQTPISAISLVDKDRQWFKSAVGLDATETPRDVAFCAHAILQDNVMEIPDAFDDDRFQDNPIVTGTPHVRFYAGAPIKTNSGYNIGTLCVIDHTPRHLTQEQTELLQILAKLISARFELRKDNLRLEKQNKSLDEFARTLAHDVKSPLTILSCFTDILEKDVHDLNQNQRILKLTNTFRDQIHSLQNLVSGIIDLARATTGSKPSLKEINITSFFNELLQGYRIVTNVKYTIDDELTSVIANHTELTQVFSNLISNAIKNCDKDQCVLKLTAKDQGDMYAFSIEDNGPGIPPEHHERLFKIFQTMDTKKSQEGSGIGLTIVKRLIEKHHGDIAIESDGKHGTTIKFSWKKPAPINAPSKEKTA